MPVPKPIVYLILGAAGSGRREVVADLIEGGTAPDDRAAVLLAEGEADDPAEKRLGAIVRWRMSDGNAIDAVPPAGANVLFFVTDGRKNPVDQIEAFKDWLAAAGTGLGRILCVVDCRLAEKNAALRFWYDACIHFSDVVLLNHREGVANRWITHFKSRYTAQFYPCLIECVKSGRVANPVLVLEPQTRRISQVFDDEQEWVPVDLEDTEEEDSEDGDKVEMVPAEDPYFVRRGGGRRVKEIPDVAKFLS